MAQAVELGADLADLAAEEVVVIDPLVLARGPPVGEPGIVRLKCRLPGNGMPCSYTRPSE